MGRWYTLNGKTPVRCLGTPRAIATRYESRAEWRVAETTVGGTWVSTVFLGLDHNWEPGGPPLLFETMVFPGNECWRCSTWEEAERQHAEVVEMVKKMQEAHE